MTKRKIRSSPSSTKLTSKKSNRLSPPNSSNRNPFWEVFGHDSNRSFIGDIHVNDGNLLLEDKQNEIDSNKADHIFGDMIQFIELSKKIKPVVCKEASGIAGTTTEQEQNEMLVKKLAQGLLADMRELHRTNANSSNEQNNLVVPTTLEVFVSAKDISRLLLPWSVKGILRNSHKEKSSSPPSPLVSPFSKPLELLYWEILDQSLCLFFSRAEEQENSEAISSERRTRNNNFTMLTLSTMHKLVPVALKLSLEECDVSEVNTNTGPIIDLQETAKSCFCRLVDHLYRPPFDVVYDTLLPILSKDCTKTSDSRTGTIWLSVAISTIQLMNLRLADANPKKSFQLFVRPKAFLDLAIVHHFASNSKGLQGIDTSQNEHIQRLQSLLKNLIRDGIFSLEHHMDGFRSLQLAVPAFDKTSQRQKRGDEKVATSKSSSDKPLFRGYQEELFYKLEEFLVRCDTDDEVYKFSSKDAVTVSSMLPLYLDIFFEQVSKMQKQQATPKSLKKSKATEKLGHLQFRFFSCLSGYLLKGFTTCEYSVIRRHSQDNRFRLSFLAMLGKNLDLLMRYNIYQPSLGNNTERAFLDEIGKETIHYMTAEGEKDETKISLGEWKKALIILNVLMQLNHTILHDQLPEILARCLTYDTKNEHRLDEPGICEEAATFLVTIIATYDRLRQLDYFYLCLLNAFKALSRQNELHRMIQHLAFANDNRISIHLEAAIQGSPIQQLLQIFSHVNDSIVTRSYIDGNQFSRHFFSVASSVVTKFLVGLLRNARVDSNSFSELDPICNLFMKGSVLSLMESVGEYTENTGNMNDAIMICAWTIQLKNRCEFWTGKTRIKSTTEENLGIPLAIHRLLREAISSLCDNTPMNKKYDPNLLDSLKFLACQRIQQLHRECYEKQRLAYASGAEEYSTSRETSEAQQLVGFILERCEANETDEFNMMNQWTVLSESITIWAPYADQRDVDSFLKQLLHVAATEDESCCHKWDLLISLLNDASFYEVPNVSERLGISIASFVGGNIQKMLRRCHGSSSQQIEMTCHPFSLDSKSFSFDQIMNVNQNRKLLTCSSKDLPEIYKSLRLSLRVLDLINHADISIWNECEEASKLFQSLMGMESICNLLRLNNERFFLDIKVRLISALRIAASRVLINIPSNSEGEIFQAQEEDYVMLLPHVMENSFKIINIDSSSRTVHRCIKSCTTIVDSIVNKSIALGVKSTLSMIKVLSTTFDQAEVSRGGFQYLILMNYGAILLKHFRRSFGADDDNVPKEALSRVIKERIWEISQDFCFDIPKDAQFLFHNQSIFFIAEVLRLSSPCSRTQLIPFSSVESKIVARLENLFNRDSEELERRSLSYLVGCIAMAQPSRTIQQKLTNELLLANLKGYDIFLNPLCILAKGMQTDEFDKFLGELTSSIVEVPATVIKLKIVHKIVLSVTEQSQIDVLSMHSAMIMNNCLQVMTQVAKQIDVNPDSIVEVSSLIIDMASKKDMMVVRERDIALVLARITSTIRLNEERGEGKIVDLEMKAYDATFSLVSFFLQRFSKQIQYCVSSLVISLTTMLQFSLSKSLPTNLMSNCGQKFSRLCELLLPHSDVYKKHIICLILRFVTALRTDIHPSCRKSLLPGIYCLLDIIQEHETIQLNSMLDEECRALLRSIHEGYKKTHVYKGQ